MNNVISHRIEDSKPTLKAEAIPKLKTNNGKHQNKNNELDD